MPAAAKAKPGATAQRFAAAAKKRKNAQTPAVSVPFKKSQKPAAKRTKKAAPAGISAAAALNYHNAFQRAASASVVAVPGSIGNFCPLNSLVRNSVTTRTGASQAWYVICTYTPGAIRGTLIDGDPNSRSNFSTWFTLATLSTGTLPQSVRPLALSLAIRNSTVMTSQSGAVRLYNGPEGVGWEFDPADPAKISTNMLHSLDVLMASNPKVRTYTATELTHSKVFVAPPASAIAMREYDNHHVGATIADHNSQLVLGSTKAALNTIILQFLPSPTANVYEIAISDQTACRFPANDAQFASLAQPPGYADHTTFDQRIKVAQAHASSPAPASGSGGQI